MFLSRKRKVGKAMMLFALFVIICLFHDSFVVMFRPRAQDKTITRVIMTTFGSVLKESGIDNLHKVFSKDGKKYICFIKVKGVKILTVIIYDGVDMWLDEHDEDSVEALKEVIGMKSSDAFFISLRKSITTGNISVVQVGAKMSLSLGSGDSSVEMDLFEAKAAEKKTWTQSIVFRLAEQCETLQGYLSRADEQISNLKAQKQSGGGSNALMDFGPKATSSHNKPKQSKVGMSAVNPSSRKRKAAAGVVFGED